MGLTTWPSSRDTVAWLTTISLPCSLWEIALISMAPATANAVFHATGRRARDVPIRIATLLSA
jgi:hypothetical protein